MVATLQKNRRTSDVDLDEVAGWFDWQPLYDRAVAESVDGDTLVEVGVFCAKSLTYLARRVKQSGKRVRVVGIDTFLGSPEFEGKVFFNDAPLSAMPPGTLICEAFNTLAHFDVLDVVTLIVGDSSASAAYFADRSVALAFLDGDHGERGLTADIRAWMPKIAPGGILAGHDVWTFPDVIPTAQRHFPSITFDEKLSWWEARIG